MNIDRIKEIQQETAYPDSISVKQALLKVWNECEQEKVVNKNDLLPDVSNWHFLPELPEVNVEVLIAYEYDKKPIQGYWNGRKWIGSFETRDYMKDGLVRDETLNIPEYIYAWTELPDCPEVPMPF